MNPNLVQQQETFEEKVVELEIQYSIENLSARIIQYGLKPKALCTKLSVNTHQLSKISINKNKPFDLQLQHTLNNWQHAEDLETLTAKINHLIYLWLNAIQDGLSMQTMLKCLKCFELKSLFSISGTQKLHLFLFDLLAETTHQHQQVTLDYLLNYDANTELPNTNQIINDLDIAITRLGEKQLAAMFSLHFQATKNQLAFTRLFALDLNKQIVARLKQNISTDCQLYFGSDAQFDILITNSRGETQLNLLAAKISRAFELMLFVNTQSILVTPLIGCAYSITEQQSGHDLYRHAKLALDSAIAKQYPFVIYSDALENELLEQTNFEAKVLEAFDSDNLTLFFQPIVNLKTGKCAGAELLLRWSEKFGYNVYPSLTIEILNKMGKGKLFTRWLINSACRYSSELQNDHGLNVYLTINLRAEDLYDIELPHLLQRGTALWKLKPTDILLEITEEGILERNDRSDSVISLLADSGFRLALDDFGTGYSSLSRLRTMPIDLIKIDQSFVRDINNSHDDYAIVKSVALLAKSLGKEVLVEGVEDEASLKLIKKLDIDKCQGFFFAKPMPFEQFIAWAKAH